MSANSSEKKGPSILFVCTANICRSPMAQALFLARLQSECLEWRDWRVESAGTWALDGKPASKYSQKVMEKRGYNLTGHIARTVTADMLKQFDLILTMEPGQKEALQVEFPSVAQRVYMISEMEGKQDPVADPYGGPVEKYEETALLLDKIFANGMQRIYALVQARNNRPEENELPY